MIINNQSTDIELGSEEYVHHYCIYNVKFSFWFKAS